MKYFLLLILVLHTVHCEDSTVQNMLSDGLKNTGLPKAEEETVQPGFDQINSSYENNHHSYESDGTRVNIDQTTNTDSEAYNDQNIQTYSTSHSAEIQMENGVKISIFDRQQGYTLQSVITAKTDISASGTANLNGSFSDTFSIAPGFSAVVDSALSANVDLSANATVDTKADVALSVLQSEKGMLIALPLSQSKKDDSEIILETGIKQRTDYAVFRIVNMKSSYAASGTASMSSASANGTVNGIPFSYTAPYPVSMTQTRSGDVDTMAALNESGTKTSFGSKSTYYVIPVGIGFYGDNGSKIRFLVDLKPERINKSLSFKLPKSEKDLENFFTNAIGGAQLEADGRLDFDGFTVLAGLNTSFRTFEVNLQDITGNDTDITAPSEVHVNTYLGFETRDIKVRLIAEANARVTQADAGAYIELQHSFDNGWTFGILTGFQKRLLAQVPETSIAGSSYPISASGPSGSGTSGSGSYSYSSDASGTISHDGTTINEGKSAVQEYNVVPVDVMVSGKVSSDTSLIVKGSAEFINDPLQNSQYKLDSAGGGLGILQPNGYGGQTYMEVNGGVRNIQPLEGRDSKPEGYVGFSAGTDF
jgi:hypothetical protein